MTYIFLQKVFFHDARRFPFSVLLSIQIVAVGTVQVASRADRLDHSREVPLREDFRNVKKVDCICLARAHVIDSKTNLAYLQVGFTA